MATVKKLLVTIDNKEKKSNNKKLRAFLSSDRLSHEEDGSVDINRQFNRDRWVKNREVHKKILLSSLSNQFGSIMQNKLKENQFKCYEKPKNNLMHTFKRQNQVIDQISKRMIKS